jgi:hypothetical protein
LSQIDWRDIGSLWQIDSEQTIQFSFELKPFVNQSTCLFWKGNPNPSFDFKIYLDSVTHNIYWTEETGRLLIVGHWTEGIWNTIRFKIAGPITNNYQSLFIGIGYNLTGSLTDYEFKGQIRKLKIATFTAKKPVTKGVITTQILDTKQGSPPWYQWISTGTIQVSTNGSLIGTMVFTDDGYFRIIVPDIQLNYTLTYQYPDSLTYSGPSPQNLDAPVIQSNVYTVYNTDFQDEGFTWQGVVFEAYPRLFFKQ